VANVAHGRVKKKNYLRNPLNAIKTVDIKGEISLTRKSTNAICFYLEKSASS